VPVASAPSLGQQPVLAFSPDQPVPNNSAAQPVGSVEQQPAAGASNLPAFGEQNVRCADQMPRWKLHAHSRAAVAKQNKRKASPLKPALKKQVTAKLQSQRTKWDNQDRMLLASEFSKIQKMIGLRFTLDACCNPDGSNALVPELYKSAEDSFLEYDCSGHHVWLNPPYADITPFVKHYVQCKAKSPHNTSAVIILPKWKGSHTQYLKGMHVVKEFPKGSKIFSAPSEGNTAERIPLGPTPWPVQVLYDPPVALPFSCMAGFRIDGGSIDTGYTESADMDGVHINAELAGATVRGLVD